MPLVVNHIIGMIGYIVVINKADMLYL